MNLSAYECLFSLSQVEQAVSELANKVNQEIEEGEDCLALVILNGGVVFSGMLLPLLKFNLELDYVHATRYENELSGKQVKWYAEPRSSLKGKHILLLDDIFDHGITLKAIEDYCLKNGAKRVSQIVMATKDLPESDLEKDIVRPKLSALTVPDKYVFGMGMDLHGLHRNAAGIYAVKV